MSAVVSPKESHLEASHRLLEKVPAQIPEKQPNSGVPKKKTRSPLVRSMLMLVRRSHLYFGLLLFPWALLYGITGYLFNHPTHFSGNQVRSVSLNKSLATLFGTERSESARTAQLVCDELQKRFGTESKKIELLSNPEPKWEGNLVSASFESDDNSYSVQLPLNSQSANVRITPKRKSSLVREKVFFEIEVAGGAGRGRGRQSGPPSMSHFGAENSTGISSTPVASEKLSPNRLPLRLDEELESKMKSQIAELALQIDSALAIESQSIRINSAPELVFHVDSDGKQWECRHNPITGSVAAKSTENKSDASDFSWRRFLLRLHMAHTYPSEYNARWFWAIVVDVMAFVMVFWGLSGIVMWWQIKATRPAGSVAMVISLVGAVGLAIAMFQAMQ